LAVEPRPVGDVHRDMLQQRDAETGVAERKRERAAGVERHASALPGALRQIARAVDESRAEIDAGDAAAISRRQIARRSADAGADIEHRHLFGDADELAELGGGGESASVELVERAELLRREALVVRPEHGERRL